jgi:hypothetical protein
MKLRSEPNTSSPVVVGVDIGRNVFHLAGSPPTGRLPFEGKSGD